MKRNSRNKRQRPPAAAPRESVQGGSETRLLEPDELRELSRAELVALVLKLQARHAAAADPRAAAEAAPAEEEVAAAAATAAAPPARPAGLVIDSSVRSGQTINFPEGDVTVIGSVGSGAEIVAGGSIHVYGTLRGRAIAGTSGDQTARIFCQDLDAELLSIDGRYRVADNFERTLRGRPVQARLDGLRMTLIPLDDSWTPPAEASAEERASADKIRRATDRVRQLMRFGVSRDAPLAETAAS
jgi:septum site-determining protein MinC